MKILGPFLVLLLKLFHAACGQIPSQKIINRIGALLGGINFTLQRGRRHTALTNLERILGDQYSPAERKTIARQSFNSVSSVYFEIFWDPERHGRKFSDWAPIEGLEHLQRAHQLGKGVVIATPHIGNWAVAARAIIQEGYSIGGLHRPSAIPAVRDHFNQTLHQVGIHPTHTPLPPGGFQNILNQIAEGMVFVVVSDRRSNDYLLDFLGYPAWTAHGVATLHLRSGAPLLVCYSVREGDHHRVVIEPPIEHQPSGDVQKDTVQILQQVNDRFSEIIRRYPQQWLWLHDRWRGRRKSQPWAAADQVDQSPQ